MISSNPSPDPRKLRKVGVNILCTSLHNIFIKIRTSLFSNTDTYKFYLKFLVKTFRKCISCNPVGLLISDVYSTFLICLTFSPYFIRPHLVF